MNEKQTPLKQEPHQSPPKLLKAGEVAAITKMSVSNIYTLERQGKFPKRRKLTENSTVWLENEVFDWINQSLGLTETLKP